MKDNKFEDISAIVNILKESIKIYDVDDEELIKKINNFLNLSEDSYIPIPWPESQDYMEEEWFEKEAILDIDGKFGDSAYFIPIKRLI